MRLIRWVNTRLHENNNLGYRIETSSPFGWSKTPRFDLRIFRRYPPRNGTDHWYRADVQLGHFSFFIILITKCEMNIRVASNVFHTPIYTLSTDYLDYYSRTLVPDCRIRSLFHTAVFFLSNYSRYRKGGFFSSISDWLIDKQKSGGLIKEKCCYIPISLMFIRLILLIYLCCYFIQFVLRSLKEDEDNETEWKAR